jgi:hypothetical protein
MPTDVAFQKFASNLSQSGSSNGRKGWIAEGQFEPEANDVVKRLSIGKFSEPVKTKTGEYKIFYVGDIRKPGYVPCSETQVTLAVARVPVTVDLSPEERERMEKRVLSIAESKSKREFEEVCEDFGYKVNVVVRPLSAVPTEMASLPLNTCSSPVFTGDSFEVYMLLKRDLIKRDLVLNRDEVRERLKFEQMDRFADRTFKGFKSRTLIKRVG